MQSFWDAYDDAVTEIVRSGRAVTIDDLADHLDLLRDEVREIAARLVARGVIEQQPVP
jgi:hypothetical protein